MFKNRFLVPKEISSNCLFCPRSQIITFMIWNQKKKLQIITCEQKQWHVVWVSWHLVPTTKKRKKENTQSLKMPDVGILTYVYTGWAATTNQITGNTYSNKTSCDQKPKTYTTENASLKIREINDITSLWLNNYIKETWRLLCHSSQTSIISEHLLNENLDGFETVNWTAATQRAQTQLNCSESVSHTRLKGTRSCCYQGECFQICLAKKRF